MFERKGGTAVVNSNLTGDPFLNVRLDKIYCVMCSTSFVTFGKAHKKKIHKCHCKTKRNQTKFKILMSFKTIIQCSLWLANGWQILVMGKC